jgi:signal transduction histidine kinase/CheY-like chemotaxis protein
MSDPDTSIEQRILREQADALISTSPSGSVAAFILSLGFWTLFYWYTRNPMTLVWALILHPVQLLRVVVTWRYLKIPNAQRQPERSARKHTLILLISSVIWGLAPWLFFPQGNFPLTSLMLLVIMGMVSAGMASVAQYRPAILAFSIPMLVGLSTALLWQRDAMHIFLAVCAALFIYTNLQFGRRQNLLLTEALRARYEKEDLAQRLEEQVRLVEQASREKTRFFASASHDLRQPLHSLGLFGSALLTRLKATPDEPIVRNLMHCVDALETSFSSMLDVSKLDAGVIEPQLQPVALSDVFRQLNASFAHHAQSQGLALRFKPGGRWVMADPALLERLIGNLIHNALKFTHGGGIVAVARRQISTTGAPGVSLEVWDSGVGVPEAELPRIFDEFYQVGNTERDRSQGLGMGLAIVRRLADLMGLKLQVQSRQGKGTVFKLWLPAAAQQVRADLAPLSITLPSFKAIQNLYALVIDDEVSVRDSTAVALRMHGMQVDVADGLAQACEVAQMRLSAGLPVDVIITDFRLRGDEDGIKVVAELRALLKTQTPALLVTGDTAPERVRQAQASGLRVQYKPLKIAALVDEVITLVSK